MRRLIASAALVSILVLASASQALAVISPGTSKILYAVNETPVGDGYIRTSVIAYTDLNGTDGPSVCSSELGEDSGHNGTYEYWACESVDPSSFTFDSRGYLVGLAPTSLDEVDLLDVIHPGQYAPRTVTVSISVTTSGRVRTASHKGTDSDGTCTYSITSKDQMVGIAGTLTQDATSLSPNFGAFTEITTVTVKAQCPH